MTAVWVFKSLSTLVYDGLSSSKDQKIIWKNMPAKKKTDWIFLWFNWSYKLELQFKNLLKSSSSGHPINLIFTNPQKATSGHKIRHYFFPGPLFINFHFERLVLKIFGHNVHERAHFHKFNTFPDIFSRSGYLPGQKIHYMIFINDTYRISLSFFLLSSCILVIRISSFKNQYKCQIIPKRLMPSWYFLTDSKLCFCFF